VAEVRTLGLHVSSPRSPPETNRPFSELRMFLINPARQVQLIDISNAPIARPDLAGIARGAKRIQGMSHPVRSTLAD